MSKPGRNVQTANAGTPSPSLKDADWQRHGPSHSTPAPVPGGSMSPRDHPYLFSTPAFFGV